MTTNSIMPPAAVSERILSFVKSRLEPSPGKVFSKLSGIHLVSGLLTLSACPQFGFRIFGEGMGLMHYFMHLGTYFCSVACGSFFVGTSVLFATVFLTTEEVRALRQNRLAGLGALCFLSLGFFFMVDAEILLSFALAWIVGSLLGGLATLELGWLLRTRAFARV